MAIPRALQNRRIVAAAAALALLAGCSSSDDGGAPSTTSTGSTTTTSAAAPAAPDRTCERPVAEAPLVEDVPGTEADLVLTSFDDTQIRLHWFPAPEATDEDPAPTVLIGPGWSLGGDTSTHPNPLFGALGIGQLNEDGYNVLTWDPRGFGASEGLAEVNSPEAEGRDMALILDWLANEPLVATDAPGDPGVGMVGFSYGGGIQLTVAAADCRVDAIVPGIAWNSLGNSLYRSEIVKAGWASVLTGVASETVDPHVTSAANAGEETGTISEEDREWFLTRGPGDAVADITAPTLIVQGTVDNLFTLDEGIANYELLRGGDAPVAMLWFCGGHGMCLTDEGRTDFVEAATVAWLDRWVKGDETVDLGPTFRFVDQDGTLWVADDLPEPTDSLSTVGSGTLELAEGGGAGPVEVGEGPLGFLAAEITTAGADRAAEVTVTAETDSMILGAPELTLSYTGTSPAGDAPERIFAQLVDDETGLVLGNQITPIPLTLDGERRELTLPIESVAHRLDAGAKIRLQLVATTVAYATPRLGGRVELHEIGISLPVVTDHRKADDQTFG